MQELQIIRALVLATILIGLFGLLFKKKLLLRILSMDVMSTGIISLFVLSATRHGRKTPTIDPEAEGEAVYADPVLQGVILTAIVIGFSIIALALVKSMHLARRFPTLEVDEIEQDWKEDE
jgi:multicomponent Na+:H+ antiporter subunit C